MRHYGRFRTEGAARGIIVLVLAAAVSTALGSAQAFNTARLEVTASVRNVPQCRVSNDVSLDFGVLDPENPVDLDAESAIGLMCTGEVWPAFISVVDSEGDLAGQESVFSLTDPTSKDAPITYSLTLTPSPGIAPEGDGSVEVKGTLSGMDYRDAQPAASYSDIVFVTISP